MIRVPDTASEIDAAWLSEALGAPVSAFELEILEGGVLGDAFRLYEIQSTSSSENTPRSVVVKLASRYEKRRS